MDGVKCKKCRYLLKNKDGYNWCPNKTDDPDIDLIRDCEWYAVKTNGDNMMASWKTCDNCLRSQTCGETSKYWCNNLPHEKAFWQPIYCKLCGGPLSETREHNGRKYRHCYACHMEFYEEVT